MPYAVLEKQFDLLTEEHQKSVYSYVSFLLSEQLNKTQEVSSNVSDKLSLLNSLVGVVPANVNLEIEREDRITR